MFEAIVWMVASIGIQLYLFVLVVMTITSVHFDDRKGYRLCKVRYEECGNLENGENECDQPEELEWKDGREKKVSHS
jgi:hypothetical protein